MRAPLLPFLTASAAAPVPAPARGQGPASVGRSNGQGQVGDGTPADRHAAVLVTGGGLPGDSVAVAAG